ncbi:hypothetical protein B0H13DRAFT_2318017 [Mycena leptocephala]|nr:hypothetical protein B0H13DRAFT_2318017 [Mycena leptocephala]
MVAQEWTSGPQREFMLARLSAYLAAVEDKGRVPLTRFWDQLWRDWFALWPEELKIGLPLELSLLGESTTKKKERLKSWMRYRERARRSPARISKKTTHSLFRLLNKESVKRALRPQEMYQKLYGAKIKEEVLTRGYGELNEEAEAEHVAAGAAAGPSDVVAVAILTEEERKLAEMAEDNLALTRVHKNRALRMSLWRMTSIEMYQLESDDVKREVETATAKFNSERIMPDAADDDERTPLEYQHGIDQLGHVLAKVHEAAMKETGWVGFAMLGGPMPRRGGAISTKTDFCFGTTPAGLDFQAVHPTFEDDIKKQFNKFLKRTFSHEVRDRRVLAAGDEDIAMPEGLLTFDGSDVEDDQHVGDGEINFDGDNDTAAAKSTKRAAPKRMRRKTRTQSAPNTPSPDAPVLIAPASASSPDITPEPDTAAFTSVTDFDAPALSFTSPTEFDSPALSYSEDWDTSRYGPKDFDMVLGDIMSDSTSTSSFSLGTTENAWSNGESLGGMAEEFAPIAAARPAPRAIFHGAPFEKDREVGGSPGQQPTVDVHGFNFPTPSTLFQAFTNSSSSSPPLTFGAGASVPFTFAPSGATETLRPVASHQLEAPISVANATPQATTTPTHIKTTPPAPRLPPAPHLPGPPSLRAHRPIPVEQQRVAVFPSLAPAPHASALTPPGVPVIPGFFQSRPMGNAPKGHPLAAATKKATAAKKLTKARKAPVPAASESVPVPVIPVQVRGRGRPRKTAVAAPAIESVQAPAIPDHAPAIATQAPVPATLTGAAATAEAARIRREEAANRNTRAEMLQHAKAVDVKAAVEAAEAKHERARLHNPTGGADLFITGSRPKRAITATKNPDGSARMKKRSPAELAAEEDQHMLDGFANQKRKAAEDLLGSGAPKKGEGGCDSGRDGKAQGSRACGLHPSGEKNAHAQVNNSVAAQPACYCHQCL